MSVQQQRIDDRSTMMRVASQSGFTLIEILLVITLIALSIAMIAPSFVTVSDVDIGAETRRLQQVLRLASEEAQLTGIPIRLSALKNGYHFEQLNDGKAWDSYVEPPFNTHSFSQGIEIVEVRLSGSSFSRRMLEDEAGDKDGKNLLGHLIFWPDGMLDTADIVITNADANSVSLQVRSGPGGIRVVEEGRYEL